MRHINPSRMAQRGAALAIGLILLAVTSMVTITAINTGAMQERMSANQDNHARAFMAAEAGGASLVTWIRTNGWPTASNSHPVQSNVVAGNPSIAFTLALQSSSWANSPLDVTIEGHALSSDGSTVLARTQLLVSLERVPPPAAPPVNAPAAISCFGGPCRITAGAGQGANEGFGVVSGFDHPIPDLGCTGSSCRMQPQGAHRTMPAVPAVFLTHRSGSSVGAQGGGNSGNNQHPPFQGLNQDGNGIVQGNGMDVARSPEHYPNNPVTGVSTTPTLNSVFGNPVPPATSSVPTTTKLESNRTTPTFNSAPPHNVPAEVGTFVINGGSFEIKGNDLFVGLIVIRNCGTLTMKGNPNIYGAVIVEAVRSDGTACPSDYNPFGGSGTPAVRYSLAALQRAANPPGGGGTGGATGVNVLRWTEFLQ